MLILTRLKEEYIVINDEIRVYFLGMNGRYQCKIGVEAPQNVEIHRSEIYEQIQKDLYTKELNKVFSDYDRRG